MAIRKIMKAARLVEYKRPYELQDIEIPRPEGRDVVIKVYAASFCHTDVMLFDSGVQLHGGNKLPLTGSHEAVGTIYAVGPDVDSTQFKFGDRVGTLNYYHPCGTCLDCRSDSEGYVYCQNNQQTLGITRDGGFAEYMLTDSYSVFPIPDSLTFVDAAPLMCAGVTIYKALKRCNLKDGETVGIIDCGGGLGHLGIQFAKMMGLNVVGVEYNQEALKIAKSLGCTDILIDSSKTEPSEAFEILNQNGIATGCDAVIVLPETQPAFDFATHICGKHGVVMTVSVPGNPWKVHSFDLVSKDLTIKGMYTSNDIDAGSLYASVNDAKEMLVEIAENPIHVEKRIFEFEQINQAVEDSKNGGKVVIEMLKE